MSSQTDQESQVSKIDAEKQPVTESQEARHEVTEVVAIKNSELHADTTQTGTAQQEQADDTTSAPLTELKPQTAPELDVVAISAERETLYDTAVSWHAAQREAELLQQSATGEATQHGEGTGAPLETDASIAQPAIKKQAPSETELFPLPDTQNDTRSPALSPELSVPAALPEYASSELSTQQETATIESTARPDALENTDAVQDSTIAMQFVEPANRVALAELPTIGAEVSATQTGEEAPHPASFVGKILSIIPFAGNVFKHGAHETEPDSEPAYGITLPEEFEGLGKMHELPPPVMSLSLLLDVARIRSNPVESGQFQPEAAEIAETPPAPEQVLTLLAEQVTILEPAAAEKATEKLEAVHEFIANIEQLRTDEGEVYVIEQLTELCEELLESLQLAYTEEELAYFVQLFNIVPATAQAAVVDTAEENLLYKYMREISGGNPFGFVSSLGLITLRDGVANRLRFGKIVLPAVVAGPDATQ